MKEAGTPVQSAALYESCIVNGRYYSQFIRVYLLLSACSDPNTRDQSICTAPPKKVLGSQCGDLCGVNNAGPCGWTIYDTRPRDLDDSVAMVVDLQGVPDVLKT